MLFMWMTPFSKVMTTINVLRILSKQSWKLKFQDAAEWMIDPNIFNNLCSIYGKLDMFATRSCSLQLPGAKKDIPQSKDETDGCPLLQFCTGTTGILADTTRILSAAWRPSTSTKYLSIIKRFTEFCHKKQIYKTYLQKRILAFNLGLGSVHTIRLRVLLQLYIVIYIERGR